MKRRIVGLLMMLVFMGVIGAMPVAAGEITAPDNYVFTTDTNGVIQIGDAEALTEFSKYVNEAGGNSAANAVLTADIKLNETLNNNSATNWETWGPTTTGLTSWTPIGNQTSLYTGNFDGANHTISGIYLYAPGAAEGQGLFGVCFSDIKDLKVTASYINAQSTTTVGGIAGWMDGSITNCQVEANLVGNRCVGGIAGSFSGTISGSSYRGSVTGVEYVGGIVGLNELSISIINCYNNANVTGNIEVGGIIGLMSDSQVENSANTGAIKGETEVGGICGINFSGSIVNCYQAGKVTGGDAFTGGILGRVAYASNSTNCYYLSGSAVYGDPAAPTIADGIGDAIPDTMGQTEAKTDAAFATGEVAYRLNNYSAFDQTNWRHWTQSPGDATPSLALDGSNIIDKKITLDYADPAADLVFYGAVGSTLAGLPSPPAAATYAYTKTSPADGTVYSQAEMASYQFTAVDDLVFTVKAYQLTVNNEGVIEIATPAELTEFAKYVNDGCNGANARLMADIVLNEVFDPATNWKTWGPTTGLTSWTPIGNQMKIYNGTFDGDGHTISGIYINESTVSYQGLFGSCGDSSNIKNLKITASNINGSGNTGGYGLIAGITYGSITNCQVEANLAGSYDIGGVVGVLYGTISGSFYRGSVSGEDVGGIAGTVATGGTVENSYNAGNVIGTGSVGGIAGYNSGRIANCYHTGVVTGAASSTGGILGENGNAATTSNCYYLTDSAVYGASSTPAFGIGYTNADTANQTAVKTNTDFSSGEVTWRLQNGQADSAVAVWGQKLDDPNKDSLPLLKATDRVYRLTLMKGNGTDVYNQQYRNASKTITLAMTEAYTWRDENVTIYPVVNDAADHTLTPRITTLPTAEAVYGTKLGAIAFSGGSTPLSGWSWSGTATELAQIPVVGNAVGYPATYTAEDNLFGTQTVTITPTIKSAGGGGGGYIPPAMSGITVTPHDLSFSPTGQLVVDITGLPAGATVYYSLDGSSYATTPPAITRVGEQMLYLRITCPGYQDFTTQTTVTVTKQVAPKIPTINTAISGGQQIGSIDLGALLPADRGQTRYQLGPVDDPGGLLHGTPTIDANGLLFYGFRSHLANSDEAATATAADALAQPDAAGLETAVSAAQTATIAVLVSMENYQDTALTLVLSEVEPVGVRYLTHIQDYGWETDWVTAGALSGTSGQSKRLEALKVELTGDLPAGATIDTAVHVQNQGNLGPFAMGTAAGTSGKSLRLENICLTLNNLPGYTLRYNVHVQNQGWLRDEADSSSWFTSGEVAGTAGLSLRLEGLRIVLVKDE